MTAAEFVAVELALAMIDRWTREELGDRLASIAHAVIAGRSIDVVAEKLAALALWTDDAANTLGDTDRSPLRYRSHRPTFPTAVIAVPPSRVEQLRERADVLTAAGAPVTEAVAREGLPAIGEADRAQLDRWEALLIGLEVQWFNTGRPFAVSTHGRLAA